MKKKLVVLLMASSLALAACGSNPATTTTAATETTVAESTDAESTEAESTDEAAETEASDAEETTIDAASIAADALEIAGMIEFVEKDGKYFMNYPASMFAGQDEEAIKAAVSAQAGDGVMTINDDGSVSVELTKEVFDVMSAAQ